MPLDRDQYIDAEIIEEAQYVETAFVPIQKPANFPIETLLKYVSEIAWVIQECFKRNINVLLNDSYQPTDEDNTPANTLIKGIAGSMVANAPLVKSKFEKTGGKVFIPIVSGQLGFQTNKAINAINSNPKNFLTEISRIEKILPGVFNSKRTVLTFKTESYIKKDPELFESMLKRTKIRDKSLGLLKPAITHFIKTIRVEFLEAEPFTQGDTTILSPQELYDYYLKNPNDSQYMLRNYIDQALTRIGWIYLCFDFDKEGSQFITQMAKPSSAHCFQWGVQIARGAVSGNYSDVINPLPNIKEFNVEIAKKRIRPPAVNKEGICVDKNGELVYVPDVDNIEKYYKALDDNPLDENGEYCLTEIRQGKVFKKVNLANQLVYTDWINNRFSYTDTSGNLVVDEMDGWMPVKPPAVDTIFHQSVVKNPGWLKKIESLYPSVSFDYDKHLEARKAEFNMKFDEVKGYYSNNTLSDCVLTIYQRYAKAVNEGGSIVTTFKPGSIDALKAQLGRIGEDCLHIDLASDSPFPELRVIGDWFQEQWKQIQNIPFMDIVGERSCASVMRGYANLKVFGLYLHRHAEVKKIADDMTAVYQHPPLEDNLTFMPKNIPMVKDIKFLPHQGKIWNYLKNLPDNAILNVQAGGGKTIVIVCDVLYNVGEGKVKHPLICCPAHLVQDYVKEINYATKGRVNPICITMGTMRTRRWGKQMKQLVEKAPPNTICITDFYYPRNNKDEMPYGTTSVEVWNNAEFVQSLDFDGVWVDESHLLRNATSAYARAVAKIIAGAKVKRLATGTFLANTLADTAGQVALIDPTIFGSKRRFVAEYSMENSSGRSLIWKPDAERKVRELIDKNCNFITIKRREWAARLPPRIDRFLSEELTPAQRTVYEAILTTTRATLEKNAAVIAALKGNAEGDADEIDEENIARLLKPFLARLEQFISSPASDILGDEVLKGEDRISPKSKVVNNVIREHLSKKIPGKILVFTEFRRTAKEIYNSLPPDIKKHAIPYLAADKVELVAEFKRNPDMWVMIGVAESMSIGLNLQFCSRLIRVETVWTPADLEQGDSRINRPNVKEGKDIRPAIYFDTVSVNRTIDVTKASRLVAKQVSNAKFEAKEIPEYGTLPEIHVPPMTLDNIFESNDFETEMHDHLLAMQRMQQIEQEDFDNYRKRPDVRKEDIPVPDGKILPGSKLLKYVPYVPGMEIFDENNSLHLMPYNAYVELHSKHDEDFDPIGLNAHTDWGDGEIVGSYKNSLAVRLASTGKTVRSILKESAFIITKDTTSTKDIRKSLAKLTGLDIEKVSVREPLDVDDEGGEDEDEDEDEGSKIKTRKGKVVVKPKRGKVKEEEPEDEEEDEEDEPEGKIPLSVGLVNGMYALTVPLDKESAPEKVMRQLRFNKVAPYIYVTIPTPKHLKKYIDVLESHFTIHPFSKKMLDSVLAAYLKSSKTGKYTPSKINPATLKNYYRIANFKRVPKGTVKPYVTVENDQLKIMYDIGTQPSVQQIVQKVKVPGAVHHKSPGEWVRLIANKAKVANVIKWLVRDKVGISNMNEVTKEFKKLR